MILRRPPAPPPQEELFQIKAIRKPFFQTISLAQNMAKTGRVSECVIDYIHIQGWTFLPASLEGVAQNIMTSWEQCDV